MALCLTALLAGEQPPPPILIAIDPGHGGDQDGAIGPCGAREKDVTLAVSRELAQLLAASGRAEPLLLRDGDATVALQDRPRVANLAGAGLLVSIHANASTNPRARGVETFFLSDRAVNRRLAHLAERENEGVPVSAATGDTTLARILNDLSASAAHQESQRLAIRLQEMMNARLDTRGRGVLQAPFVVLIDAEMPAALVEVGFLTHPDECRLLASLDHQRAIARALAVALLD